MNIVAFAFKENISEQVLKQLGIKNSFAVPSNYSEIDGFVQKLIAIKPQYVLGLGMYSRTDKDKLRIETKCSLNNEDFEINNFLHPLSKSKLAKGIGNSYCNYVSVKIMQAIKNQNLKSKYTFVHIPKAFSVDEAVQEITTMISNLNNLESD